MGATERARTAIPMDPAADGPGVRNARETGRRPSRMPETELLNPSRGTQDRGACTRNSACDATDDRSAALYSDEPGNYDDDQGNHDAERGAQDCDCGEIVLYRVDVCRVT